MKMKHFIPGVALAMLLTVPAFAEVETTTMSTPLNITVGDYFRIHRGTEHTAETAVFTGVDDYSTFSLNTPLIAEYIVYTNNPDVKGEKLTLKGTIDATGDDDEALYGTGDADLWLMFANTVNKPDATAVANCRAGGSAGGQDNPNIFTLKLTPTVTKTTGSGSTDTSDVEASYATANRVKYSFSNGIYTFNYATASAPKINTFSTADTAGTYTTTLTVTRNGA